jgi:hypothetical protein
MGAISDLVGASGVIEQQLLWNVVSQVISNLMAPAFGQLQQDVYKRTPNVVLTPDILARAVVQTFMDKATAVAEAEKSGTDATRFDILLKLADIRLQPADVAEAVLRSYMADGDAEREVAEQGYTADRFKVLTLLAGDGIGPQDAAVALRRGYIGRDGTGPDSTSYEQAIAESRLHNKWADVVYDLTKAILSPPDAADAVVRGFMPLASAVTVAALNGMDAATFATMVDLAGDAPSPTDLTVALRRGVIPYDSGDAKVPGFVQGIRQGRLSDKWIPMIAALSQEWPTPTDALEARLVGQVDDQKSQALYQLFGGDPDYWQLLYDTRGESPTPLELIALANRGDIPWDGKGPDVTSYAQGFDEGRWRDKWEPIYRKLAEYLPPESTVVTLLSRGALTDDQAADLLTKQGMDPELVAAYIDQAHSEALSSYRGATTTMVLDAYYEQLIPADLATKILATLHMTPPAIDLALGYEDIKRSFAALNSAFSRVRSMYASRKITLQTAKDSLVQLGIPPDTVTDVLGRWQLENSIDVKTLSPYELGEATLYGALTVPEAIGELQNIGYTAFDAWVLLCAYTKSVLPDKPPVFIPPLQDTVIPGTT